MTLTEYLDSKGIPYQTHVLENGQLTLKVEANLLLPHAEELSELFPKFKIPNDRPEGEIQPE